MATLKAVDEKIREYWEYIDGSNVMEMMAKAISDLANEPAKPLDIIHYIRVKLGDDSYPNSTADTLKELLAEATEELELLEEEVAQARSEARLKEERLKFYKKKKAKILSDEAAICAKEMGMELQSVISCEELFDRDVQ